MVRKILLSLIAVLGIGIFSASAQNKQVTGTVIGAGGTPLDGATVLVDGTNNASITNASGQFTIMAPENGTLVVSFVGYSTQRVPIGGKVRVDVTLKEAIKSIDDVMVVAFGTTTRGAFVGSANQMKAEDLAKHQTSNVLNALAGSVPGLQIKGSSAQPGSNEGTVNIRGISSLYAGTSPLVIVDGSPYPLSLSNIPQSDIESISVLKDASAAAIYGSRGASGVILVTTRKAKGRGDAIINVDMKWGVNTRVIKDYDVITDPGKYYEAYYAQLYNQYYYGQGLTPAQADAQANTKMLSDLQYNVFTYPTGENLIINGKLNPKATLGRKTTSNGVDYWMQPDNWTDLAYRSGLRQEYTASVNGATDRSSYYMGLGYLDEKGIVSNTDFNRITARIKTDYQAKKWMKVGANAGYIHSVQDVNSLAYDITAAPATASSINGANSGIGSSNLFFYTSMMAPIYPAYVRVVDADGNVSIKTDQYGNQAYDFGVAATGYGVTRPFMATGNPLGENQYNKNNVTNDQLNATGFAEFQFIKQLKLNISSTVTWNQMSQSRFGNMFYGTPANTGGSIDKQSYGTMRTNNLQTLTYTDTFCTLHHLDVLLGHEYYNSTSKNLYAKGTGMFSPEIQEISAAATKVQNQSSSSGRYNTEGYLGRAQYDYASKYYLSGSFRRDASSRFAPEHRWGNFWSFGGAWIVSKEKFMSGISWVDMLKLKSSIGQQGNDNIPDYCYIDTYTLSSASPTQMAATFNRKGNHDITWETTTSFNSGIEFSLFRGRISGDVEYYRKKTTDLLFWISIPESSGSRGVYDNIGDIRNVGVEATLSGAIVRSRLIDWNVSANITYNTTKILSLPASKIDPNLGGYTENSLWYTVGGPLYNYYCVSYAGVDQYGKAMYWADTKDPVTNKITAFKTHTTYDFNTAGRYAQGTTLPKVYGGFSTTLRVKDFDLSASFDYQIGGRVMDSHYASILGSSSDVASAGNAISVDWTKAWSPTNTSSDLPRWQYGDLYNKNSCDRFLTSASYLNFQSFTVGYTVPSKLLKTNIVKIRVYAAGENLWFWSARQGMDPRFSYTGIGSVAPFSPYRTISGGVQFTF